MEVMEIIIHVVSLLVVSYYVFGQECGPYDNALTTDSYCMELMFAALPTDETVRYKCKSLLIRTAAKIDYCPSKRCESGTWTSAQISCGATECYPSGDSKEFQGRRTCTATGYPCQRWDEQYPNEHAYNVSTMFPEGNATEAENYCRDPDGVKGQPWCYTTNPNVTWDFCDVPSCADITIDQGKCPGNYCGDIVNSMSTDNVCAYLQPMSSYYDHYVGTTVKYSCVSLLDGFVSSISYCPVRVCQEDFFWSNVSISCAENECYDPANSGQYEGGRACTQTGRMCQYWESQSPHPHNYTTLGGFPDPDEMSRGANCRDPGNLRGEPWCFTTDPNVEWEPCDVYNCNDMISNNGRCGGTVAPTTVTTEETTVVPATVVPMTSSANTVVTVTPTPPAPVVPRVFNSTVYQRIPDRAGFDEQATLPYVTSSTDCCRRCSKTPDCVMVTFENGTCTLFRLNGGNSNVIDCSLTQKCYLLQYLV